LGSCGLQFAVENILFRGHKISIRISHHIFKITKRARVSKGDRARGKDNRTTRRSQGFAL